MSEPPVVMTIDPAQRVNAPSIALLVLGILGGVLQLLGLAVNVLGVGFLATALRDSGQEGLPNLLTGGLGIAVNLVGLVVAAFIIWVALRMKALESWGAAVAASIVAMLPCISPCCILGLPIGIWCLVVLLDANVKPAFR